VRVERDETKYPSRGSWPRYRGRVGTIVQLNRRDGEIGVAFSKPRRRADGSLLADAISWFLPHELVHTDDKRPVAASQPDVDPGASDV
jgi:hypothetical protein